MFIEPATSIWPSNGQADVGRDLRAPAVGADHVLGADLVGVAGQAVADRDRRAVLVLGEARRTRCRSGSASRGRRRGRSGSARTASAGGRKARSGWPACSRPGAAGCVPQVRTRPISSPARLVQNTVSPIRRCGVPLARMSSSMPRSRMISTVRWLVMCARGVLAVQRYLVITMWSTPRVARKSAAEAPAGPEPITRTSVVRCSLMRTPVGGRRSCATTAHPGCGRPGLRPAVAARRGRSATP